jgi:GT2 family glycosyltransferase
MPSVLIVVLDWNGVFNTRKCVEGLLRQTYRDFEILLIDNGSIDVVSDNLNIDDKRLKIIRKSINTGFAGGVNTGIKKALRDNFDYVALINNDAIPNENWLECLIKSAEINDTDINSGVMLNVNGDFIDSTGELFSIWGISAPRYRGKNSKNIPKSGYVFGSTGGAVLYKVSLFKDIGLFDETFFAYYEDADINFRAQLAGYKASYTNKAIAYHQQGATSNKIPGFTVYHTFKNLPLLFWKNIPTKLLLKVGSRFILLYMLIFANAIKHGSGWPALKGVIASIWYFWKSALWKRFKIQHNKKVSADYIWSILYHDLPPEQTGMRKFRKLFTGKN